MRGGRRGGGGARGQNLKNMGAGRQGKGQHEVEGSKRGRWEEVEEARVLWEQVRGMA